MDLFSRFIPERVVSVQNQTFVIQGGVLKVQRRSLGIQPLEMNDQNRVMPIQGWAMGIEE